MARSGYINGRYYQNLFVSGENGSLDPNQHVLKATQGTTLLTGSQTILLTYVSEKANGEFVTQGYKPHNRTEVWNAAGDYIQPKEKIPKKRPPDGNGWESVQGILNLQC